MISFPNCKINLGLYVLNKRADGFHNISSLFYPVPYNDVLEIIPSKDSQKCTFTSSGLDIPGDVKNNLCVKAYNLLDKDFSLPSVKIHLHKIIPMGGGLGGGSSDGAETLKMLNALFNLEISNAKLKSYAAQLGSDCPFFIDNEPQLAEGRGEQLSKIDISLKGKFLVLVFPKIHVSTKEAYNGVLLAEPSFDFKNLNQMSFNEWKDHLKNNFEHHIFESYPKIKAVKDGLYEIGADYSLMSGSGSTVFGIFKEKPLESEVEKLGYDYKILEL